MGIVVVIAIANGDDKKQGQDVIIERNAVEQTSMNKSVLLIVIGSVIIVISVIGRVIIIITVIVTVVGIGRVIIIITGIVTVVGIVIEIEIIVVI